MYKFLLTFFFLTITIVFIACSAAKEEGGYTPPTNQTPVLNNLVASIYDDIENGDIVGTMELLSGDINGTTFTIFSGIYDSNGTELQDSNITIQTYLLNKERLLTPTEFQIDNNGIISVKTASLIDYLKKTSYKFYVVAQNDAGISQLGTVSIEVKRAGRIKLIGASYINNISYLNANNDILIIYFDRPFIENSISNDLSNAFIVNGEGKIGSNSLSLGGSMGNLNYTRVSMQDGGTLNVPFHVGVDTIKKSTIGYLDENGLPSSEDSSSVIVEKFNLMASIQSGSNICIQIEGSDEDKNVSTVSCTDDNALLGEIALSASPDRNFTSKTDTNIDNQTLLEWQKVDDNVSRTFDQASSYCMGLTLDEKTDWRVPTMQELETLVDRSNDKDALMSTIFTVKDANYWSKNEFANQDQYQLAWHMDFSSQINGLDLKSENFLVRCVRDIKE